MHIVVVLNWYGRVDTLACVRSLINGDDDIQVLVVDNGSFDGTLNDVRGVDRVRTLQLPWNVGFSGGMNRGLQWAMDAGADTVTILNNDTVVPPGAMVRLAALASGAAAVSPTVMYRDDPDRIWFAGGTLDVSDGYPHHTAVDKLAACRDELRETELLAGCCVTASSATWHTVGLFDDRFFLNFEDSEWSVRARHRGVRLLVACDVRIFHAVSASFTGAAATLGGYYFLRNGLLFSRIVGAGCGARRRFVRKFGFVGLRSAPWQQRRRALLVVGWAVAAYAVRRFGEAPAPLRNRVARWNRQPTA